MKRPTPDEVRTALRPLTRWNFGRTKLIEAVELRSGILVVEYEYRPKLADQEGRHRYIRSIAIKPWWDRAPLNHTIESGYLTEGEQSNG